MTWIIVELEPWEYERAHEVGIRRLTANWNRGNARHYDPRRMEDDRTAHSAGAICELAVAKHLGLYWPGHVWAVGDHARYRDVPDIPPNIEVRRIRTDSAAVRRHQLGKGLQLWAARAEAPEFRRVAIAGWIDHDEAWAIGEPAPYDRDNTRLIHYANLTPATAGIRGIA